MAMTYQPNWTNARVLQRAFKCLTFVEQYTKPNRVEWISVQEIYKHFGNTSRPLGLYLKELLLEPADPYYNPLTGVCKKYRRNNEGYKFLRAQLGDPAYEPSAAVLEQIATGDFEYQEKSDRLYTAAQYIPKRYRGRILANHGYRYHYDIEAAAPTVLLQSALKQNPKLDLLHLDYYINNRTEIRQRIAHACEISIEQTKTVINAVLHGGIISRRNDNRTFMDLNYNYDAVIKLNNNPDMINLKKDISLMWKSLKDQFPIRYSERCGKQVRARTSPREKGAMYRSIEKEIGEVIMKLLKKEKARALWIHDGWCCDKVVDPVVIQLKVKQHTGYAIKLDWSIYED